ncbi:MAG: hypothetical protein ABSG28_03090 [Methanoregula sp.]|jgi:acetyltransferase-like isoleucine patch superfamily enzyme|uniref:acyltransferase n=1 Tax=Methanoregula sp. TaxID=2052170 RepID=UPI003C28966E
MIIKIKTKIKECFNRFVRILIYPSVMNILRFDVRIFTDPDRVFVSKTAYLCNALLNTNSGTITIGEYTFFSHNVSIITGTHDYSLTGRDRMTYFPKNGYDIVIGNGVWIGSNVTIIGPCVIGDNSVIAAGAVVINDVTANSVVAGVPAKLIRMIPVK